MTRIVACLISAAVSLIGCGKKSAPAPKATVADLKFPVLWVFGDTSVLPIDDAAGLATLHSNRLNIDPASPKHLIDASLQIYRVDNLRSTRSGLGQMLNPVGATPIAFELERGEQGIEPVRRMIAAVQYLGSVGSDHDSVRGRVSDKTTLEDIIAAIREDTRQDSVNANGT